MSSLAAYNPQMESFEFEFEAESPTYEFEVFNEAEQMELAAELLEVRDEAELEQFLGSLIKKAGRAVGKFVKSDAGRAIGGFLKSAAKKALPIAGTALGGLVGGPLGAKIGGSLANVAGSALGLELEGLSNEDREFEAAKQFVRFAGESVKNIAATPAAGNAVAAARQAIAQAAKTHAPGLITAGQGSRAASGTWIRRGQRIVVLGA
jgi:uncharacterized protein (DUF697 family)